MITYDKYSWAVVLIFTVHPDQVIATNSKYIFIMT